MLNDSTTAALFGDDLSTLDQLFVEARAYRSGKEFQELLQFIGRFPNYAPYNCFLLHTQNPGVRYVANARQWRKLFNRRVVDGGRPLVILVPFGPVDFVYDVGDTSGGQVPDAILDPFNAHGELSQVVFDMTIGNCGRDLIKVVDIALHTNNAGYIGPAEQGDTVWGVKGKDKHGKDAWGELPAQYRLRVNSKHNLPTRYATITHELAHLYCGHLGTPNTKWWPDRQALGKNKQEFEAESVAYLLCTRLKVENPSARYLSDYLDRHGKVPEISLEAVLWAAGMIERMGREQIKPRKPREERS